MRLRTLAAGLTALLLLIAIAALTACGGGDASDTDGERPAETRDTSPATQQAAPEGTRRGILGRIGSQPTDEPEAQTTRQGTLSRGIGQATTEPEATEEADRITPPSGGAGDRELAFVSAGSAHTCGVRRDGSVVCWGWDEYGQATPP